MYMDRQALHSSFWFVLTYNVLCHTKRVLDLPPPPSPLQKSVGNYVAKRWLWAIKLNWIIIFRLSLVRSSYRICCVYVKSTTWTGLEYDMFSIPANLLVCMWVYEGKLITCGFSPSSLKYQLCVGDKSMKTGFKIHSDNTLRTEQWFCQQMIKLHMTCSREGRE